MIKLFGTANEKYLREVEVFYNSTDSILYYEYNSSASTAYTKPVSKKDLINLFKKGLLVVNDGSGFVRPTVLTVDTDYAAVSHTTVGSSSIAVATTFYSEGYDAE